MRFFKMVIEEIIDLIKKIDFSALRGKILFLIDWIKEDKEKKKNLAKK